MRCMGRRFLSHHHTIEIFHGSLSLLHGDVDVLLIRLWWLQQYFFISTNMKFSHIHIIMHRRGPGGFGGGGRERGPKGSKWVCYVSTSVVNALGRAAR